MKRKPRNILSLGWGCVCVVAAAGVLVTAAAASPRTDEFVGSKRELALIGGALAATALLEYSPPNEGHPLLGGKQKSYIERERVPDWLLASAHLATAAGICYAPVGHADERNRYLHGYVAAASLNAFGTAFVKGIIGRRRPNYDDAKARGAHVKSKSFYSGHASNSFLIATYATLYTHRSTGHTTLRVGVPLCLYGAAAYTAWTRVAEHRHYTSDVLVGAGAGSLVAALVFRWYDGMAPKSHGLMIVPSPRRLVISVSFR